MGASTYYVGNYSVNRGGTLSYLHGDHLGSMSVATDAGGGNAQSQRFYAYGGTRPGANDLPTDYAFTGQRNEVLAGLYQMGARWHDQDIGRFVQADTVVPDWYNPQTLNRYSYTLNNPVKYRDPAGHDPLSANWRAEFRIRSGRDPDWRDERVRLFELAYPDEARQHSFHNAENAVDVNIFDTVCVNAPQNRSWDSLPEAVSRLSKSYEASEKAQFAHDVSSLWAGLPLRSEINDIRYLQSGQTHQSVHLGRGGLNPQLLDEDLDANVHHWAAFFAAGYALGADRAIQLNEWRELQQGKQVGQYPWDRAPSQADVWLGGLGAQMGGALADPAVSYDDLPWMFDYYLGVE